MLVAGKKFLVTGVLTEASIAFATARLIQEQGGEKRDGECNVVGSAAWVIDSLFPAWTEPVIVREREGRSRDNSP